MKTDNLLIGTLLGTVAGTVLLSMMEMSEEITTSSKRYSASQIKDRTLFNHGNYVTTWYKDEVREFDECYIKFNGDPYQIYGACGIAKSNNKSLEEIMARVGVYNRKNTTMNTKATEGMQG